MLDKLIAELKFLQDEKVDTEKELETLNYPLQLTAECISMRDCRRGTELTYDEADTELKKELCVIENIKKSLTDRYNMNTKNLCIFKHMFLMIHFV